MLTMTTIRLSAKDRERLARIGALMQARDTYAPTWQMTDAIRVAIRHLATTLDVDPGTGPMPIAGDMPDLASARLAEMHTPPIADDDLL